MGCAVDRLDRANREAWGLYNRVASRFCHEWGLMAFRLTQETAGWDATDVVDLLDRLDLIFDALQPPQETRRA
jgi:hypothetical protein